MPTIDTKPLVATPKSDDILYMGVKQEGGGYADGHVTVGALRQDKPSFLSVCCAPNGSEYRFFVCAHRADATRIGRREIEGSSLPSMFGNGSTLNLSQDGRFVGVQRYGGTGGGGTLVVYDLENNWRTRCLISVPAATNGPVLRPLAVGGKFLYGVNSSNEVFSVNMETGVLTENIFEGPGNIQGMTSNGQLLTFNLFNAMGGISVDPPRPYVTYDLSTNALAASQMPIAAGIEYNVDNNTPSGSGSYSPDGSKYGWLGTIAEGASSSEMVLKLLIIDASTNAVLAEEVVTSTGTASQWFALKPSWSPNGRFFYGVDYATGAIVLFDGDDDSVSSFSAANNMSAYEGLLFVSDDGLVATQLGGYIEVESIFGNSQEADSFKRTLLSAATGMPLFLNHEGEDYGPQVSAMKSLGQ